MWGKVAWNGESEPEKGEKGIAQERGWWNWKLGNKQQRD